MPVRTAIVLILFALLAAASGVHAGRQTANRPAAKPATAEIELLIKQALEDRLAAKALPDMGLLGNGPRIPIRKDLRASETELGPGALPQQAGATFYLSTLAELQAEADKTGKPVFFIAVERPSISGDTATVWLGVAPVAPRDPKMMMLCCCGGLGQFQRRDSRWSFVKWLEMVCS